MFVGLILIKLKFSFINKYKLNLLMVIQSCCNNISFHQIYREIIVMVFDKGQTNNILLSNKYKMNDYTAKLKQEVTNPNKTFTHTTSKESTSKEKTINSSQDIESFLSLILDLIKTNAVNAQKEIRHLKDQTLKKKLLDLNTQFNYFKYRVKKLQYFKGYLQRLFQSVIKDDLVKPSLNDYRYEVGLIEPKLLERVVRLTNNSKILQSIIEGRKLKVEEYYQFGTENVIKQVGKINQKQSSLKTNPTINEQQLYDQFMKLSKGTFNRLNTKMHFYCKQKATLDLLSSINTQILQNQQKVKCQCANNNNLVYQKRDHIKNLGLSRQKIQKKSLYNSLNQDQFREQSKNIQQLRNVINQLRKESHQLTDKNQRLAKQIKSKKQTLKNFQSYETINQSNKRFSVQINQVKAPNKHQQQQIRQLQQINKIQQLQQTKNNLNSHYQQYASNREETIKSLKNQLNIQRQKYQQLQSILNQKADALETQLEELKKISDRQRKINIQSINKLKEQRNTLLQNMQIIKTTDKKQIKTILLQNDWIIQSFIEKIVILNKEAIKQLQNQLRQIESKIVENKEIICKQTKVINLDQNMNQNMKNTLSQEIVKYNNNNGLHLSQIGELKKRIYSLLYISEIMEEKGAFCQTKQFMFIQTIQKELLYTSKKINHLQKQSQYASQEFDLFRFKTQGEQNFLVTSKLARQNKQLSHSLQILATIQNNKRQQQFQYKNMLLKTIIYSSQKMEQIKHIIQTIIQFLTGSIHEFNPVLLVSYIQNIQTSTNDILNYIRQIQGQVNELSQQSLEQCDNNKNDD